MKYKDELIKSMEWLGKKDDVLLKIKNQWTDEKKIPLADYIFRNSSENENQKVVVSLINHFNSIFV